MVKHIVLWKLKEELSKEEKDKVKKEIKEEVDCIITKGRKGRPKHRREG